MAFRTFHRVITRHNMTPQLLFWALCSLLLPWTASGLAATSKARTGGTGFGALSSAADLADESADINQLRAFLQANKGDIDQVQVSQHDKDGRGLFARKAFNKVGKIICRVPSECVLALSDPAEQGKDVPTLAHNGVNLLKLYLKDEEKRKQWAPYLNTLPKTPGASTTPDFMENEEIDLLEFPSLVAAAKERKEQIASLAKENGFSVEELQYATWLVSSRSLPLAVAPDGQVIGESDDVPNVEMDDRGQILTRANRSYIRLLVPWLDLVNHNSNSPNAKITIIDPHKDSAWFALEVLRPIKKGQEIRIAYGSGVDSSSEILQNYGFVPDKNRMDSLMLRYIRQKAEKDPEQKDFPLSAWTTTLQEDQKLLTMAKEEGEANLEKIMRFRIKLKESYETE